MAQSQHVPQVSVRARQPPAIAEQCCARASRFSGSVSIRPALLTPRGSVSIREVLPFMLDAKRCSVCGERMGFIKGCRGFGWMETRHEDRCRQRASMDCNNVAAMSINEGGADSESVPHCELVPQFRFRPSVGTWLVNVVDPEIHARKDAFDGNESPMRKAAKLENHEAWSEWADLAICGA